MGISVNRRRSSSRDDRLANLIKIVLYVLEGLGVPKYSSARSNHVYSFHAKVCMLVVKQYLKCTFRSVCDIMVSAARAMKAMGMRYVPHHSTLVKFSSSIDPVLLDNVLNATAMLTSGDGIVMAVDATGMPCDNASWHYVLRIQNDGARLLRKRDFTKVSLAVDTAGLTVMACETSLGNVHDVKHIPSLLDKIVSGGYDVISVVADKGYDSEDVHKEIQDRTGAETIIPTRRPDKRSDGKRPRRTNRRRMAEVFSSPDSEGSRTYRKRSMAETVNSMIKRKMGGNVSGHTDQSRHKETMCRCIAHNVMRALDKGVTA